jgi:hypothetical protein
MTRLWLCGIAVLALAGCAMAPLPLSPPSAALVGKLSGPGPRFVLGAFVPGRGLPSGADKGLAVRGSTIHPENGSFAAYLGETLRTQLSASGRLDPTSALMISGVLVRNQVSSGIGTGHAELAAEFTVIRGGIAIFRKTISARREWDSSFIGAAAIPAADIGYAGLYTMLIERLFDDPDFRTATAR